MRLREEPPVPSGLHWPSELTAGLTHIRTEAALRRMTIALAIGFLVIGINELALFAIVGQGLRRPPELVGVLASAQGVGAIAGGLWVARLIGSLGELVQDTDTHLKASPTTSPRDFWAGCAGLPAPREQYVRFRWKLALDRIL